MAAADSFTGKRFRLAIRLPRPRWIGLAAVVLIVVATGLRLGLPIYRQQAAIREIVRLDGNVDKSDAGPPWLRRLIGDERMEVFDDVTGISLFDTEVPESTLASLRWFPKLEYLELSNCGVTDASLAHVRGPVLCRLTLSHTPVTDAGLLRLQPLTNLWGLELRGTQVTDEGLAHLRQMTNLHTLDLRDTQITDAGLVHLRLMKDLYTLQLGNTQITDAGLAHLYGLTNLVELDLDNSQITDSGLKGLAEMASLKKILVRHTAITSDGTAALRTARPGLFVGDF